MANLGITLRIRCLLPFRYYTRKKGKGQAWSFRTNLLGYLCRDKCAGCPKKIAASTNKGGSSTVTLQFGTTSSPSSTKLSTIFPDLAETAPFCFTRSAAVFAGLYGTKPLKRAKKAAGGTLSKDGASQKAHGQKNR